MNVNQYSTSEGKVQIFLFAAKSGWEVRTKKAQAMIFIFH
jgi:hypothetical protein